MLGFVGFIIILTPACCVKGEMVLRALGTQTSVCNERAILQCNISSTVPLNILQMFWKKEPGFQCDPVSSNSSSEFDCSYTKEALTLTIFQPTPAKMGKYFCCLMADSTHACKDIDVSLGNCRGEFSQQTIGPNHLQCSFTGVYPMGTIQWFHYEKNVTSNSTVLILENTDGTFNVSSDLNIHDNQERYNCSLWSLIDGIKLQDQQFEVAVDVAVSPLSVTSTQHCSSWILILLILSLRGCTSL